MSFKRQRKDDGGNESADFVATVLLLVFAGQCPDEAPEKSELTRSLGAGRDGHRSQGREREQVTSGGLSI
jgi:hypothetical protein